MTNNLINNYILETIKNPIETRVFQDIFEMRNLISQWLQLYNLQSNKISQIISDINSIDEAKLNLDLSKTASSYAIGKTRLALLQQGQPDFQSFENTIKAGYVLLHQIRKFFTGKEVTYDLAFISDTGNLLGEYNVSLEQFLPHIKLSIPSKKIQNQLSSIDNFKLMSGKTQAQMRKIFQKEYQKGNEKVTMLANESNSAWSSIYRYLYSDEYKKHFGEQINIGWGYEAYKLLTSVRKNRPGGEFTATRIEQALSQVVHNTQSYLLGGDTQGSRKQNKALRSMFSVSELITITSAFNKLLVIFEDNNLNYNNLEKNLQDFFIKKKAKGIGSKIENQSSKEAKQYLKSILNKFGYYKP